MKEKSSNAHDLKSGEVDEVLGKSPPWPMRWGILIILISLILLLVFLQFIKYPDRLTGSAVITSLNPPVRMLAKTNGRITLVLDSNEELVDPGSVIAFINNEACYRHVMLLDSILAKVTPVHDFFPLRFIDFEQLSGLKLGDVAAYYSRFEKTYNEYNLHHDSTSLTSEVKLIDQELVYHNALIQKYRNVEQLLTERCRLVEKDFNQTLQFHNNGFISEKELETKKQDLLLAKQSLENSGIMTLNTHIGINQLQKIKLQLREKQTERQNELIANYNESLSDIKNAIVFWKNKYLIQAPVRGKLAFNKIWATNQNISTNDEVVSIVSIEKKPVVCKLKLPTYNIGKVKPGQTVFIELNDYPYLEYGRLIGNITSVSAVYGQDGSVLLDVQLPKQLRTTLNKSLAHREEITGNGIIITEDINLLNRFFNLVRK